MNIKPLYDKVVIELQKAEEKTSSGIYIPETVTADRPQMGTVVAVGTGKMLASGEVKPLTVKVGEVVAFGKYGPAEVTVEGKDYLVVKEEDILAIIA